VAAHFNTLTNNHLDRAGSGWDSDYNVATGYYFSDNGDTLFGNAVSNNVLTFSTYGGYNHLAALSNGSFDIFGDQDTPDQLQGTTVTNEKVAAATMPTLSNGSSLFLGAQLLQHGLELLVLEGRIHRRQHWRAPHGGILEQRIPGYCHGVWPVWY
jgi:hypothetical protein